jgi:hypothetical protein
MRGRSQQEAKIKIQTTTSNIDTEEDLVGLDFKDDGQQWTITEVGFYEEHPVLYYKSKDQVKKRNLQ